MSIVRVGLSSTKKFAEGWEAIFGRKKTAPKQAKNASRKTNKAPRKKSVKKR